jgi:hypothetical protein
MSARYISYYAACHLYHFLLCCWWLAWLCPAGNIVMLVMWLVWAGLLAYTQSSMASMKPFDPFEILNVPRDATDRDIKKAYRKLSLVYHPDKVCLPAASHHAWFDIANSSTATTAAAFAPLGTVTGVSP